MSARLLSSIFAAALLISSASAASAESPGGDPPSTAGPVATSATLVQPLKVGDRAPKADVLDADGEPVRLNELYAEKPTVLIFFRGGWCPYCVRHLSDLATVEKDLIEAGFQIAALSPDLPKHLKSEDAEASFTLLSDREGEAAKAFGLAFRLDDATHERYLGFTKKIDVEERSGRSHRILPVPAVYIVDKTGTIRFAHWDPEYKKRLSGQEVLKAAREIKP